MITIGGIAGHHFHGRADMQVAFHCTDGKRLGYFMGRKRLVDREAYDRDPRDGWETDRWFQWIGTKSDLTTDPE